MTKPDNNPYQETLDDLTCGFDVYQGSRDNRNSVQTALALTAFLYDNRDQLQGLVDAGECYEVINLNNTDGTLWVPEQVGEDEWEQRQVGYVEGENLETFITKAANTRPLISKLMEMLK